MVQLKDKCILCKREETKNMFTKKTKKVVSQVLCATMLVTGVTGCAKDDSSSSTSVSQHNGPYEEFITVDVFDSQANFQGIQTGWFAKIVKDKFNMELNIIAPNVAGGGDTLYQTRSANGNLGDLIITNLDNSRLKDMVSAGLLLDMTDYISECENLQNYEQAIAEASALAEQDGTWAVPSEISSLSATEPAEATDPTNAPSLRWDLYAQIGYPEMDTLEDLLDVLSQMQEVAGQSNSGKNVYALSLFKDWDGDIMQNAGALTALYGYEPTGFVMAKVDGSEVQSVIDSDGIYVRALKFLFDANQMGLVDPESTTQNFDNLQAKYTDGAVLYSLWPWLGAGVYNTADNTAEGKGFATATINDMKVLSYGNTTLGSMSNAIMIGSKAKDPQRMADFIDWLYSSEGILASATQTGGFAGPEGLTWELKDGEPVLTDFGVDAFVNMVEDLEVPAEWGTGTWKDGISTLNYKAVGIVDVDPNTGFSYNYARWDDYQNRIASTLTKDWSEQNDNALTAIEYLTNNDLILVKPGTNYANKDYPTEISTIKELCKQIIVEYSWKMVFAENEAQFDSYLKEMQDNVIGLGYEDVLALDQENVANKIATYQSVK